MLRMLKKRAKGRKPFGFHCDEGLADRVRETADEDDVPYYIMAEHLLELGLDQILGDINRRPEGREAAIRKLQEHLFADHWRAINVGGAG